MIPVCEGQGDELVWFHEVTFEGYEAWLCRRVKVMKPVSINGRGLSQILKPNNVTE